MARQKFKPGPIPTLGELRQESCWLWVHCEAKLPGGIWCKHQAPMALAAPIILWGPAASSNVLRTRMRCTRCGARHTSLQHPSHVDAIVGTAPFPVVRERTTAR